ncbi:hypothetical protein ACFL12_07215 [Pseudomonadota bacterium]
MITILVFAAVAFVVGFVWGYMRPASYCHLSSAQRHAFANRASSGLINGAVLAAIVAVIAYIAL